MKMITNVGNRHIRVNWVNSNNNVTTPTTRVASKSSQKQQQQRQQQLQQLHRLQEDIQRTERTLNWMDEFCWQRHWILDDAYRSCQSNCFGTILDRMFSFHR
jgi:hypothetical protein